MCTYLQFVKNNKKVNPLSMFFLFLSEKYWYGQMVHVWKEFMPIELEHEDMHPCSFLEIFAGDYAGGYYSFTWSKVMILTFHHCLAICYSELTHQSGNHKLIVISTGSKKL